MRIFPIQSLDTHAWNKRRAARESAWEQGCQAKLAAIVAVVEIDESRRFSGGIKTLDDLLKSTDSDFAAEARIRKLLGTKLGGRTRLFEVVEEWRNTADRASRLFCILVLRASPRGPSPSISRVNLPFWQLNNVQHFCISTGAILF